MCNVSEAQNDAASRALFEGRQEIMPACVGDSEEDEDINDAAVLGTEPQGTTLRYNYTRDDKDLIRIGRDDFENRPERLRAKAV